MLRSCLLLVLLVSDSAGGQPEKEPPYQVPTPKGWVKETIVLPPAFAPGMKWKGKEELRFAPGWQKADADTFFSYGLLFWLPNDQKVDPVEKHKHHCVFICASPQPETAAVWKTMREIRAGCTFP